jgi:hypothetical protein
MTRFFELPRLEVDAKCSPTNSGEADRVFPSFVAQSHLHLWRPGDPIPANGLRVLIGIATWSEYDLHLLDVANDALADQNGSGPHVDVFSIDRLSPGDFDKYVPGLAAVHHTPIVGIWQDGSLLEKAAGFDGRELAARLFGSSSSEIVDFVTKRRAAASIPVVTS